MREILFRGKRIDNNEWVYGYLCLDMANYKCIQDEDCNSGEVYAVDESTIGQYTGLKDKNGVEIYEGDKVMFDYEWTNPNEIGVITWNEGNASFQIKGHIPSSSMKHLSRMKVIGNIYDDEVN